MNFQFIQTIKKTDDRHRSVKAEDGKRQRSTVHPFAKNFPNPSLVTNSTETDLGD